MYVITYRLSYLVVMNTSDGGFPHYHGDTPGHLSYHVLFVYILDGIPHHNQVLDAAKPPL
jgi:hypothetical protein